MNGKFKLQTLHVFQGMGSIQIAENLQFYRMYRQTFHDAILVKVISKSSYTRT
jgi:hypothetical protein